jgi:SSS family solute:Na+ symporter
MVAQLLPIGFKGVVVCGLLAALMSSLASLYNSSAALFVGDFYKKMKPGASEQHLVIIGRIATATVVILGVVWIPVMLGLGKVLYEYLQAVQGLLAPAIATVFLLGVFWKRTTAKAAFWGMILGFGIGMFRLFINVTVGIKASLALEAEKLMLKINSVTEFTRELLVSNIQAFSDKIGKAYPAIGESLQTSVKEAAGAMAQISPESKEHAYNLLSQVSGKLDSMLTEQYGILYNIAAINSHVFTSLLFIFCLMVVIFISLFTTAPTEKQLDYTMMAATAQDKALTRASWNKWDVIHTAIVVTVVVLFYIYFW